MDTLIEMFDAMKREEGRKVVLGSVYIASSLDYDLFREDGKNVLLLDGRRYEIPDHAALRVEEDEVYVDNRTAFPVSNQGEEGILTENGERILGTVDRIPTFFLVPEKEKDGSLGIQNVRQAQEDDRIDKRIPLFVYRIHDGRGHEFPVEVFRGGRNRKRRGRIMYGTMEIYANAEDDDSTVLSLISQLLSRAKTSVYFLPFYDGESLFFFGKRKKITTDRDSLGDPNCFYVEKGEHPIKKYKELFFLYLKKRIVEIGFEMGLDLRRWEVKVGDYRSFFACNAYSRKFFRFDYRNVAYRKDILDALIVHEVCHCYHHNHSKAFYALCERYWANYRYYDMLLNNGVFNEKLLSPEEREIYLPDFGPDLR